MNKAELMQKAQSDEEMTVKEIKVYRKLVKPTVHTYGKYGNLARIHLQEHNTGKLWALAGDLPEYLHGIDRQADELYKTMCKKLSDLPEYRKTDDFMKNLQIETEIKNRIDEEILNELVYVD